jgi:hypothetical protein
MFNSFQNPVLLAELYLSASKAHLEEAKSSKLPDIASDVMADISRAPDLINRKLDANLKVGEANKRAIECFNMYTALK